MLFSQRLSRQIRLEDHTTNSFTLSAVSLLQNSSDVLSYLFCVRCEGASYPDNGEVVCVAKTSFSYRPGEFRPCAGEKGPATRGILVGKDNKVGFELRKTELVYITRTKDKREAPEMHPRVFELRIIQTKESALQWLGVWFDRRLTFRQHVKNRVAVAMNVACHVESLANTVHGPLAEALRESSSHMRYTSYIADIGAVTV